MQTNNSSKISTAIANLKGLKGRTIQGIAVLTIFGGLLGNVVVDFWQDRPLPPSDPRYLDKDRLTRFAERGDRDAQFELGNLYFTGHKVKASEKDAVHWYTLAAKQGHPIAQYQLGLILQINGDDEGALSWLIKAADSNIIDAQNRVGNLYIKGTQTTPSNGAIAARYFLSAAEQGHTSAMHNLAHLLKNGAGIPKDDMGALFWMKLATATERDQKVRAQMSETLAEWVRTSKKSDVLEAEKAATARLAKGFKPKSSDEFKKKSEDTSK